MAKGSKYQSYRQALAGNALPLAWLDLDAMQANADAILQRAAGKPVRIVSKSIRCAPALRWLLDYHPGFQGILCYHPAEAVFLSALGFDDLLVAYPSMQAGAIRKVCEATAAGKHIVLMVDCHEQVGLIDATAREIGVVQPLCFDLDMSLELPGLYFGVHRSPLRTVKQARELYELVARHQYVQIVGAMGYEAQIAGLGDRLPGKRLQNLAVPTLKQLSILQLRKRRQAMVQALWDAGAELQFVNGGGTGSLLSTREDPSVTEIAVGSGFFSPYLFDFYSEFRYQPAAGFALEIARQPADGYWTCNGGGYLASGAPGPEKQPQPWLPEGLRLDANEGAGEVQTPLLGDVPELSLGDPVFFRHAKAGELCERFDRLHVMQAGRKLEEWPTYRGHGQNFI